MKKCLFLSLILLLNTSLVYSSENKESFQTGVINRIHKLNTYSPLILRYGYPSFAGVACIGYYSASLKQTDGLLQSVIGAHSQFIGKTSSITAIACSLTLSLLYQLSPKA